MAKVAAFGASFTRSYQSIYRFCIFLIISEHSRGCFILSGKILFFKIVQDIAIDLKLSVPGFDVFSYYSLNKI